MSIPRTAEEIEIPTVDSLLKKLVHNENSSYFIPNYKQNKKGRGLKKNDIDFSFKKSHFMNVIKKKGF